MLELRFHGFGGQGVVTVAELTGLAGHNAGIWSQTMPYFGPERSGTPVEAYARFSDSRCRSRERIINPDWLIILSEKLLANPDILRGIKKTTKLLAVSSNEPAILIKKYPQLKKITAGLFSLDADIWAKHLGNTLMSNTVILGALSKLTGVFGQANAVTAIENKLAGKNKTIIDLNKQAVHLGYENIHR
ncbi:hypothetical protein COT94_01265 [Candidatus Falkowbacteria bacterium CG10_big_fil_rev_8_21_14_0_10_37_14]|uniref:Pyruvate/ketoisovalerate oxidoreductase catalytic domain-containing protein n=1 Tax=Candidatus Falkowbacteria bacterium CG10_big_fil_rev_8_21_14_0_10_37_14 TaxID=1974561 RepID=A0A2M6WU43_9BACT|nr:hypothetical protein [Candidatus Falkowbacteria bacterium]PIT96304.1 MAG: hypothetical protein COT94_01265 [Candidatus Falkowbacteria bacterium CG10_big_fil_rev_8_21_14_0_10_37_14]